MTVADDTDFAVTLHCSGQNTAPGDCSDAADAKGSLNQRAAKFFDLFDRLEHAGKSRLDIFREFVDDIVAADLNLLLFGQSPSPFVGNHIEPDDNSIGSVGQ